MLLDAGAALDMDHPEGVTPLMYAAAGGFPEVHSLTASLPPLLSHIVSLVCAQLISFLLERGADVNKVHKQGGSALMEAATAGNVTVMQTLLGAGADPLIVDDDGVTALMSAASQGHTEIAKCVKAPLRAPSVPPPCPLYALLSLSMSFARWG